MSDNLVLTADIGGTHITSAIVDISTWQILEDTISRSHVNSKSDAKSILLSWKNCLTDSLQKTEHVISHIGIAMPGPFDYEKGISLMLNQDKYDALYQLNIQEALQETLDHKTEIRFINDAAAFLQGEVFAGDLSGRSVMLGITLGTGLGSAVWKRGQKAFDADLWNSPYNDTIFEEYLVTRWLTKRFEELSGIAEKGFKDIIEKHRQTEAFDILLTEYAKSLYDFLSFFAEKYQCHSFILGGSIAKAWPIIESYNASDFRAFEISTGQYAEKAAMMGAASLFKY